MFECTSAGALSEKNREPSACTIFVLSGFTLFAIGALVYWITPPARPLSDDIQGLLTIGLHSVQPEPAERYTYVALAALAPLVIGAFAVFARRVPFFLKDNQWLILSLIVAGMYLALPQDLTRRSLVNGIASTPSWIWLLGVSLPDLQLLGARLWSFGGTIRLQRISSTFLCLIAVGISLSWRVFGVGTLNDGSGHFDAFFFSLAQTYYGGTCLVNVLPQYGCYGEFLSPILRITGFSVVSTSILMVLIYIIGISATVDFCRGLIRSPLILTGTIAWVLIVQNRVFWGTVSPDPYLQYWPLRTIFPALSLLVVTSWQADRSSTKALLIGFFAGISVCWNLDSGAIVLIALLGFIAFSGATSSRFFQEALWRRNLAYSAVALIGVALSLTTFDFWLAWKSGQAANLANYLVYQKTFYVLGFQMLPMPPLPDMWAVALGLALLACVLMAVRIGTGPYSPRRERAAYLSALAVGLFSYFNGRSDPIVFIHACWPFVLLLGFLLDSWKPSSHSGAGGRIANSLVKVSAIAMLLAAISNFFIAGPAFLAVATNQWKEVLHPDKNSAIQRQVDFINAVAPDEESLAILAYNQGALVAGANRRSSLPGPSLFETLRKQDAQAEINAILTASPDHLFIGRELLSGSPQAWGSVPWVFQNLDIIEKKYWVDRMSPDDTLLHLVLRADHSGEAANRPIDSQSVATQTRTLLH